MRIDGYVRKTYLSTSLRIPFTKQNFSTYFIKYNNIFIQLKRAKIENRFEANRYFFLYYAFPPINYY